MAGYDPEGTGIVGMPYSSTQLQILMDINDDADTGVGDGDTNDSNENIIYTYDSIDKKIYRKTGGGDQLFSENIDLFLFKYWKGDGITEVTSATDEADIRQIELTITARTSEPDPNYEQNSGYRTYTLISYITPRNLDF